jgi:hypothetical protein
LISVETTTVLAMADSAFIVPTIELNYSDSSDGSTTLVDDEE